MAKLTNTSDHEVYVGSVKIDAHSTAEVPDEELATAKQNKMVESWFANGTLKMGEAETSSTGTSIHPNIGTKAPGSSVGGPSRVSHSEVDKEDKK